MVCTTMHVLVYPKGRILNSLLYFSVFLEKKIHYLTEIGPTWEIGMCIPFAEGK